MSLSFATAADLHGPTVNRGRHHKSGRSKGQATISYLIGAHT